MTTDPLAACAPPEGDRVGGKAEFAEAARAEPSTDRPSRDRYDLCRFVSAQAGIYPRALGELRAGMKTSHWIWFVFPQLRGLGDSANARLYGIAGLEEARAYAAHDLLGPRLVEATGAMLDWAGKRAAPEILGVIDAMKFRSSMTLFERAWPGQRQFTAALEAFSGGRRDPETLDRLEA